MAWYLGHRMVPRPLGSRPLLLFLLLVLRGLLLIGLVLRGRLVELVRRCLLLVRPTEEAREETQLRKQD